MTREVGEGKSPKELPKEKNDLTEAFFKLTNWVQ